MDEAECSLPAAWELPGACSTDPLHSHDHKHKEGCGHEQIAHGDHFDWLVPMNDGSFLLSHSQASDDGSSQFIEHGRLVRVGQSLGRLKRHSKQLYDLFGYEIPKSEGYGRLDLVEVTVKDAVVDDLKGARTAKDVIHTLLPSPDAGRLPIQEQNSVVDIPGTHADHALQRTALDVLGICCPGEVPLINKILEPLPGVKEVSVNVTSKTVIVLHDPVSTPEGYLVKVLNDARLNASIHRQGEWKTAHKWPSPYTVASGVLITIAFFQYIFSPLKWVALGAVAVGVPPIVLRSWVSLQHFVLDINVLMLIAVSGAIGLGDYLEAGSIVFLFTLADWLESRSSEKARLAVSAVMNVAPHNAVLADGGVQVPVTEVKVGTKLAVKAGESIPIDGVVISGKSSMDESSLTGESIPVEKEAGAIVWAGTINMSGFLYIETTVLSGDSAMARMVRLVEDAQAKRSHTEQLVEQFAKYYTPAVVMAAVAVATIPWAAHIHGLDHWLYLSLVLLVVACPCALVISTPVVTACGIAQAAQMGLIIKGGSFLEALGKLKVVAMDKTGTLTEGHFHVADVLTLDESTNLDQMLYWISCLESQSSHPMAAALVAYARLCGVEPSDKVQGFEILPGEGVFGIVHGHQIHIGNHRLASRLGWIEAVDSTTLERWSNLGTTVCWIGVEEKAIGIFSVGDQARSEAAEAVAELKKLGIRIAMLTGDSSAAAENVRKMVGEIDVFSDLLPEDKVHVLQELKAIGMTGMVGDGINDAPALAAADVSFAMGIAGSAVAMETSDIALMTNDLRKVAAAVRLGRKSHIKIRQNVLLSFISKAIIIALAAAGYASLWAAVLADVGACLVVVFNSMLMLDRKKGNGFCRAAHCHSHNHDKSKDRRGDCCSKPNLVKLADAPPCCEFSQNANDELQSAHACNGTTATNPYYCNSNVDVQVHAEDFGVTKSRCHVSGKSSNSGIRRRSGHNETCRNDCQGVDCFSLISTPEIMELPVTMNASSVTGGSGPERHYLTGDSSCFQGVYLEPSDVTGESNSNVHHCCSMDHVISFHARKVDCGIQKGMGHKETCTNDSEALGSLSSVSKAEGLELRAGSGNIDFLNASYGQGKLYCASESVIYLDGYIKSLDVITNAKSEEHQFYGKSCHSFVQGRQPDAVDRHCYNSLCESPHGEMEDCECYGNSCHQIEIQDTRSIKHVTKGVDINECQKNGLYCRRNWNE